MYLLNIIRPCGELVVKLRRRLLDSFHSLEEYCFSLARRILRKLLHPVFHILELIFHKIFQRTSYVDAGVF